MVFCCLSSSKSCYLNIKVKNATDISRLSGICRVAFILDEGDSTVKLYCVTFWIFEAQLKGIGIILFPKICHGYTIHPLPKISHLQVCPITIKFLIKKTLKKIIL